MQIKVDFEDNIKKDWPKIYQHILLLSTGARMLSITTSSIMTVSNINVYAECHYVIMESVFNAKCHNQACYAKYHYAEYHYAEYHYAEWHYAECLGTLWTYLEASDKLQQL